MIALKGKERKTRKMKKNRQQQCYGRIYAAVFGPLDGRTDRQTDGMVVGAFLIRVGV